MATTTSSRYRKAVPGYADRHPDPARPVGAVYSPVFTGTNAKKARAANRVIQARFGSNGTVRLTPTEAKALAVRLMSAAAKDPTVSLRVEYTPPGCKHPRAWNATQADVRAVVEDLTRAVRAAEGATP